MGESFWQNNSLVTHILFDLQPIMIFSPVANFGTHPLGRGRFGRSGRPYLGFGLGQDNFWYDGTADFDIFSICESY